MWIWSLFLSLLGNVTSRVWNQAKALPSSVSPKPSTCVCRSLTYSSWMAFLKAATWSWGSPIPSYFLTIFCKDEGLTFLWWSSSCLRVGLGIGGSIEGGGVNVDLTLPRLGSTLTLWSCIWVVPPSGIGCLTVVLSDMLGSCSWQTKARVFVSSL